MNKKSLSLDEVCFLVKKVFVPDHMGQQLPAIERDEVFCAEIPTYSVEFYRAARAGIELNKILAVNQFEYEGQTTVEYRGASYGLKRIFERPDGLVELYLTEE